MKTIVSVFAAPFIILTLTTFAVSATTAAGDDNAAAAQQNEPAQHVGLLEYTTVQNALGLNADQKKEIADISKTLDSSVPDPDTVRELPSHQREAVMHEWETKAEQLKNKLAGVLDKEQLRRLQEIALQLRLKMRAGALLAEQSLAKELSLTPQQKESLQKLHDSFQQQISTAREALMKAGSQTGKIAEDQSDQIREDFRRLRDEAYEKAMGLLTPEQKQKLSKMTGEIADVDIEKMMAEQSARMEKWTKRWRKESGGQNEQQQTAPADKSGQEHPVGTTADDPQTKQ